MTNSSQHSSSSASERALAEAARGVWASDEPDATQVPSFRLTWDSAVRRAESPARSRSLRWGAAALASLAVVAVAALLVARTHTPTLQEDLALARSVSYESVWRSPSDRLLAKAPAAVMRDMPDMPQPGLPNLAEEYL
jgi:hypothetical protein